MQCNLAIALDESGDGAAARQAYEAAIRADRGLVAAHVGLGGLASRAQRFDDARRHYLDALTAEPDNVAANLALYELAQVAGRREDALAFQLRALERQQLFSAIAPQERRRVLVLLRPGDWQANIPVDFLFDAQTTTVHKFFLLGRDSLAAAARLPACDVIFNAIGEADDALESLEIASAIVERLGLPAINDPARVLNTNRVALVDVLRGIESCVTPSVTRVTREDVAAHRLPIEAPLLVRPVGSHAGHDLAKIDALAELDAYLESARAEFFYVSPFVEYRQPDGFYRKYRIICVDGEPHAYHLAISPNWMIHYYNAPMAEQAWMRAEEERYLADFPSVFGPPLQRALREIARAIGLDYFGIDCSIDPAGNLLVFEADPAMIVHMQDPVELFGYKRLYVPQIFASLERLLDSRARSR